MNILSVPPEVSIEGYSDPVGEDKALSLTCDITPGNPSTITTLFWEFAPRYAGTESQALPAQRKNEELRIESTLHSDAGTYKCTAGNGVGTVIGQEEILIHCMFQEKLKVT